MAKKITLLYRLMCVVSFVFVIGFLNYFTLINYLNLRESNLAVDIIMDPLSMYVVTADGSIYDRNKKLYLMLQSDSLIEEASYIYAYKNGDLLIIDKGAVDGTNILVYLKERDASTFIRVNDLFYNNSIKIKYDVKELSDRQLEIYQKLQAMRYNI